MFKSIPLKWRTLLPLVLVSVIAGIATYWFVLDLYKQSQIDSYVEKARSILLSAESVRDFTSQQQKQKIFIDEKMELDRFLFTVPIYSAMQVAKAKADELNFKLKIPKKQPRNPDNFPDEYELKVLEVLESRQKSEFWEIDQATNNLRFFRPVELSEDCMKCHGDPKDSEKYWGRTDGKDITGTMMEGWKAGQIHGAFEIIMSMSIVDEKVASANTFITTLSVISTLLIALFGYIAVNSFNRGITKAVTDMVGLSNSILNGNLDVRGDASKLDKEFQQIISTSNQLIESFVGPFKASADYINRISIGDIPQQIQQEYKGDFNNLKNSINNLIANTEFITSLSLKLSKGDLDVVTDKRSDNDKLMENLSILVSSIKKLSFVSNDLSVAATSGKFNERAKLEEFEGEYQSILLGINNTLDSVVNSLNVSANVMIGNVDGIITYMNSSAKKLFTSNEESIRKAIPTFSASTLIGRNIDDFHKNPSHQRSMLKSLNAPHTAYLNLANLKFRLVLTPMFDSQGGRTGYIVEWFDETQQINFNQELKNVIAEIINGNLEIKIHDTAYTGDYAEIAKSINSMLDSVVGPINEAQDILSEMSKGDLTIRMLGDYHGDFERLKTSINNLGDSLLEVLHSVSESVLLTTGSAEQLSSTAENLAAAVQEQSSQSDDVASAVEEMSRTITENALSAGRTAEMADRNGKVASEGSSIVIKTIEKMKDIAKVVMDSATNISRLGESSKQIGEITSVIDDIADQTNLLALNAAIEAARAGEQGRGFAVVADEVRKLAERTSDATKQIANMIKSIQDETNYAVVAMNKGSDEVQAGISLADSAGSALNEILSSSTLLIDMINQIAAASEEQSATSEEISKNVLAISKVNADSAQRVESIARSADNLNRLTEQLAQLMKQFKTEASNMVNAQSSRSNMNRSLPS